MRVIEGGEVVSSGDGGGGTCHNDKPGQSKDKVLKFFFLLHSRASDQALSVIEV